MIKTRTIPVLLGLVMVAAACGGSDAETVPPTAAPTTTTTTVTATTTTTTTTTIAATTTTAALLPAPDADIIAFTEAFGVGDSDTAWSYVSARCGGGGSVPVDYVQAVDGYAAAYPGATAVIVGGAVGDNDTALITYNVYDGSGEFAEAYASQQWAFVDGKWYRDAC